MKDQRVYLKIKIKSLADEARTIRAEEKKHTKCDEYGYNATRVGLHFHRVVKVRSEARHTLLAYGFIRKKSYRQVESTSQSVPDWDKVWKMVDKYGIQRDYGNETRQEYERRQTRQRERFEGWKSGAKPQCGEVGALATPRAASPSPSALEETPEPTAGKGTGHFIARGLSAVGRMFT